MSRSYPKGKTSIKSNWNPKRPNKTKELKMGFLVEARDITTALIESEAYKRILAGT